MSNICSVCGYENDLRDTVCLACGSPLPQITITTPSSGTPTRQSSGLQLPPDTPLKQGEYYIQNVLGQGGFGITYQGIFRANSAAIAIKELWPENGYRNGASVLWPSSISPADKKEQIEKFKIEAAYLQRCKSPNVADIYDCFEENDTIYMVMEFIDGSPLSSLAKQQGRLDESKVISYIKQIANALSIVHQNGLLHRDIKPENIMVDKSDRAVLIDFGTAREFMASKTSDMTQMLTPGYAPFEQYSARAKRFPGSDIYALCASMYELLTGELPSAAVDRATAIAGNAPDPLIPPRQLNPNISAHLERTILMGMRFRVEERIPNAQELIQALEGKLVSPLHQKAKDYVRQRDLNSAVSTYEKCVNAEPNNGDAAVELALVLVYVDPDLAEAAARRAIQVQPQDGRSYGVSGLVHCRRQQWHNAQQQLKQGLTLSSREAWMLTNYAWVLGHLHHWEEAEQKIQQSLQFNSTCSFALGVKAWILFNRQQWKATVQAATQALHHSQGQQDAIAISTRRCVYPLVIAALSQVTQKLGDVQRRVQAYVTEFSNDSTALGLKAWSEYRSANLVVARDSFERASQCHPCPEWVLRDRGLVCEQLNDLASAVQCYENGQQHNPQDPWLAYRLGTVLGKLGQWPAARTALEQAVKQDPSLAPAHRNLGWVLSHLRSSDGKVEFTRELLSAYRKAIKLYETSDRSQAQQINALFSAIDMSL